MVFTDEHTELRKEGEKWMKDTASACSVVAALIVTVMFAAAITVPGGNSDGVLTQGFNGTIVAMGSNNNNVVPNMINGTIKGPIDETPPDEGLPVFRRRRAFKIFYVNNVDDLEAGNYVAEEDFSKYKTLHRGTVNGKWKEDKKFLECNNVDDIEAGKNVGEEDFSKCLTLYQATVHGKWNEAQKFLEDKNNNRALILVAPINFHKNTVLHDAAKTGNKVFVENLVAMMGDNNNTKELGVVKNRDGLTALHFAARFGNREVAEILVGKNPNLLYQRCNRGLLPIHYAACNTRRSPEVFRYFWGVTKDDNEDPKVNPYAGPTGATILVNLIKSKFYVVAMELANKYPALTCHLTLDKEISPLEALVKYDYPIFDKITLRFWQTSIQNALLYKMSVEEKMVKHEEAKKLVECLCDKLKILNDTEVASLAKDAIIQASYLDIEEVVEKIVEANPTTAYYKDKNGRNILHIAVENRSRNVYDLICGTNVLKHDLVDERDNKGNTIVHLAGKLAPSHKLNSNRSIVSGAALQMQRELRWFKEVQKIAPPYFSSLRNKDDKTAKMVFTDEHKDLKKEGEKWMKETATACSIIAALIVTVVFAAAITVPGGNSEGVLIQGFNGTINNNSSINGTIISPMNETTPDEGFPIFSKTDAFRSFYVFNSISLFTSVPSLLLFLSILTSRYAEEDFLHSLPLKLIAGIITLLASVISMMGSFSTTVYLVFGKTALSARVVLMGCAGLAVAIFVLLQFRLFLAFLWSTYGQTILKKLNRNVKDFGIYLALYRASVQGNWDKANRFFRTHKDSIQAPLNHHLETVLHVVARAGTASFAEKLVKELPDDALDLRTEDYNGGLTPLHLAALYGNVGVAEILVGRKHTLLYHADNDGFYPIHYAACNSRNAKDVFRYFFGVTKADEDGQPNPYQGPAGAAILVNLIRSKFYVLLWKSIPKKILMHQQATDLLRCLCDELEKVNDYSQVVSLASDALLRAVHLDIAEVVLSIVEAYPTMAYCFDHNSLNILYIAVENRCENIFNLIRGTTLQMQRELQWFKEVQKIALPYLSSCMDEQGQTPEMHFTENHRLLKIEGEKWMKETATSCTIAAALIVTVVFAAAITVPGGNSDENGLPIFSTHNSFTVFAISNAASLFTAATSLLVFLSVLTSRYAEQDFLYALPNRLIIGLITLFFSIIFMMTAFSSTIYLVFGQNRSWIRIIVPALASLPVTSFVLLQFPLLVALVSSTYGPGIFSQRGIPQMSI
nr:ankyrin repeat-containing protein NPR4-like isoform X3 [Ipomoea batatas]